jgi:hypothetical protein
MSLPAIFGSWEQFLEKWCAANPPEEEREIVEQALSVLQRLWPERVTAMVNEGFRGLMVISPAIRHGLILSACEKLTGFENVLRRVKGGERSAYIELMFGARLVKAGYSPVLEPPLAGKALDTLIPTDDDNVYCEVIAPETSEAINEVRDAARKLSQALRDENPGKRIEVLFTTDIDEVSCARVLAAVKNHALSDEIWELDSTARISTRLRGNDPNVGPTIPSPPAAAIVGAAEGSWNEGVGTVGIVRIPVSDERARRLMEGETHHFSRDQMNILVMDVSKIVSNFDAWCEMIERGLQPNLNRRFGAVVVFTWGRIGEKMSTYDKWRIIVNPHAYRPVPEAVLDKIISVR